MAQLCFRRVIVSNQSFIVNWPALTAILLLAAILHQSAGEVNLARACGMQAQELQCKTSQSADYVQRPTFVYFPMFDLPHVSSYAVDGNPDDDDLDYLVRTCSHAVTNPNTLFPNPWWRVDLEQTARVSSVQIYSDSASLNSLSAGFEVLASDTASINNARPCYSSDVAPSRGQILPCEDYAKHIWISGQVGALRLCEVKVWGVRAALECSAGDYWKDETSQCEPCPGGTTSSPGSDSIMDCTCPQHTEGCQPPAQPTSIAVHDFCRGCSFWRTSTAAIGSPLTLVRHGVCDIKCSEINLGGRELFALDPDTFGSQEEHAGGLQALEELSLADNYIESLPDRSFASLSKLRHLDLSNNLLWNISSAAFEDLTALEHLLLGHNRISRVHHGTLHVLPILSELDLSFNMLQAEARHGLDRLPTLQTLNLDRAGVSPEFLDIELTNLTLLSLNDNPGLQTLPASMFDGFFQLKTLSLAYCAISQAEAGAFDGLRSLEVLYVVGNHFSTAFPVDAFRDLESLNTLELCANRFGSLPAIESLPSLKTFYYLDSVNSLPSNAFSSTSLLYLELRLAATSRTLYDNAFVGLPNLRYLDIQDNYFSLTARSFSGLAHLEHLRMGRNYYGFFSLPQILAPVPALKILRQYGCGWTYQRVRIQSVPDDFFRSILNIEDLDLAGCGFENSPPTNALRFLPKLKVVLFEAATNERMVISTGEFSGLTSLEMILLTSFNLISIESGAFEGTKLKTLLLTWNYGLTYVAPDAFRGLETLETLQMRGVGLTDSMIHPLLFAGLDSLQTLWLDYNQGIVNVPTAALSLLSSLRDLVLGNTGFQELLPHSFFGLHSLQTLSLASCALTSIHRGAFQGLSNLEELRLELNSITSLEDGALTGLHQLRALNLQANSLAMIGNSVFRNMTNLIHLDMSHNYIAKFIPKHFGPLTSLESLSIKDNPLTCLPSFPKTVVQLNVDFSVFRLSRCLPLGCEQPASAGFKEFSQFQPGSSIFIPQHATLMHLSAINTIWSTVRPDAVQEIDVMMTGLGLVSMGQHEKERCWCVPEDACFPLPLSPLVSADCGNGLVDGKYEECDDGNIESGDGCDPSCHFEFCGDGILTNGAGETCDDGNRKKGDGCSESCQVEVPRCLAGIVSGSAAIGNLASQSLGAIPFGSSSLSGYCSKGDGDGTGLNRASSPGGVDIHCWENINDEREGNSQSWIPGNEASGFAFVGVRFPQRVIISGLRVSRDSTGAYRDRSLFEQTVQYSVVPNPGHDTPDEDWVTLGLIARTTSLYNDFHFDPVTATGIRLVQQDLGGATDELFVYADTTRCDCGDSIVTGMEECDDGNVIGGDGCGNDCRIECGNGQIDESEECDDGNRANDDGCSSDCLIECGNGQIDGSEECDDGNRIDGDGCDASCLVEFCGDANVNNKDSEQCDDGNLESGDGCDSECVLEFCGDGIVNNNGESCDNRGANAGGGADGSCKADCTVQICGDGDLGSDEACDDGNLESGDGCDSECVLEFCGDGIVNNNGESCDNRGANAGGGADGSCKADCTVQICGDGDLGSDEACDDGNINDRDGCDSSCVLEDCSNGCCGDGIVSGIEECDDGALKDGDGCSATCRREFWCPTVADQLILPHDSGSVIYMPPGGYGNNDACRWNLVGGYEYTISFSHFNVENGYDFLTVSWCSTVGCSVYRDLFSGTGFSLPAPRIVSVPSGTIVQIQFDSDSVINGQGFALDYHSQIYRSSSLIEQMLEMSHIATVNGVSYATIDNHDQYDFDGSCQGNTWFKLPPGWALASDTLVVQWLVAKALPWGTYCVLLDSGVCYGTSLWGGGPYNAGWLQSGGTDTYRTTACNTRILVQQQVRISHTSLVGGFQTVSYNGYNYATLDNHEPTDSSLGCQDGPTGSYRTIPDGWSLVSYSANVVSNVIKSFPWGTICLVLNNGDCWGTNQRLPIIDFSPVNWLDCRAHRDGLSCRNTVCYTRVVMRRLSTATELVTTTDGFSAVQYQGSFYATVDNHDPLDDVAGCQNKVVFFTLERGWTLVSFSQSIMADVVAAFPWGTLCLLTATGSCYRTALHHYDYHFNWIESGHGGYRNTLCNTRVLMVTSDCNPPQQNGLFYNGPLSCAPAGHCTNAANYHFYDFPGYSGAGSCRIGGNCVNANAFEYYTIAGTDGPGSCGVGLCTNAEAYEYYRMPGYAGPSSCEISSCNNALNFQFYTVPGINGIASCGVDSCTNALPFQYYTAPGLSGSTSCSVELCTNAAKHEYYVSAGSGGVTQDSCVVADCDNAGVNQNYTSAGFQGPSSCGTACAKGYWLVGDSCKECPPGRYKHYVGDEPCSSDCINEPPANEAYVASPAASKYECTTECAPGYHRSSGVCTACPAGHYKSEVGDGQCTPCQFQVSPSFFKSGVSPAANAAWITFSDDAWTSNTQCNVHCIAGHTLSFAGPPFCVPCSAGTYKPAAGNGFCTACPQIQSGLLLKGDSLLDNSAWKEQLDNPSDRTAVQGWTRDSQCEIQCLAGYELVHGTCQLCGDGNFKGETGNQACFACSSATFDSILNLPANAQWTYDPFVPRLSSAACSWACNAGYGAKLQYVGGVASDIACEPCEEAGWAPEPQANGRYLACRRCDAAGLGKPPNAAYIHKGTLFSGADKHNDSATACTYSCSGVYSGMACDVHPLCEPGQFYNQGHSPGTEQGNGSCFKFFQEALPFYDARQVCIDIGHDLATLGSKEENEVFRRVRDTWYWKQEADPAHSAPPQMTYHGLSDRVSEGTWYYVNGRLARYQNWGGGTADDNQLLNGEDCAVMGSEGFWDDFPCNSLRPFVCEVSRVAVESAQCDEQAALQCPQASFCTVVEGVPECTCPEGFVGDGLTCSSSGWTVKTGIWLRESDGVHVTGPRARNLRQLETWESQKHEFASLLTPLGYRTGGNNGPLRRQQSAPTLPGLPAGFLTSMQHSIVSLDDVRVAEQVENSLLANGWVYHTGSTELYRSVEPLQLMPNAPQNSAYFLTVDALFANKSEAEAALQELLFNLEANHNFTSVPDVPVVFGVPLTPDRFLAPHVYRWEAQTTSAAIAVKPSGLQVDRVHFLQNCKGAGCWVVDITFTTGEDSFSTIYLPKAVGDVGLSYNFDYSVVDSTWGVSPAQTFLPAKFPCSSEEYDPAELRDGSGEILRAPDAVTACCFPQFMDMYRPIAGFVAAMTDAGISEKCNSFFTPIFDRPHYDEPVRSLTSPPTAPFAGPRTQCSILELPDLEGIDLGVAVCHASRERGTIEHWSSGDESEELVWLLMAPAGSAAVEIVFNFFHTAAADWVTVYECSADMTNCDVLATGSGSYHRFSVFSCTGVMVITFSSSGTSFSGGFKASYFPLARCPSSGGSGKSSRAPAGTSKSAEDINRVADGSEGLLAMPRNHLYGTFAGLNKSYSSFVSVVDPYIGKHRARLFLDETELRSRSAILRGTVGVEYSLDTFIGLASFKPAGTEFLDPFRTQTNIHLEHTNFFTISTHGTNDYTFLEYVNLRLVAVYVEDGDFPGTQEVANYVQVTFTLGAKYGVDVNSDLIPLDSVRAGSGTFFSVTEEEGALHHKCIEYTNAAGNEFASPETISQFNRTINQDCGPAATMCMNPTSIADSFVVFNIPLGINFLGSGSDELDRVVFTELVISAVDTDARSTPTAPDEGERPWQLKTTLTASVPVVNGGVSIFCDGLTAKTELKDVATVDLILGSAMDASELSRLRILEDVANARLGPPGQSEVVTDSESIESGLLTLVLRGSPLYFNGEGAKSRGISLELEDVISIHIMESVGSMTDGNGVQGKQKAVKDLLAEAANDNSDPDSLGLDTEGYQLNGAFYFTVDRASQRAHLEPTDRLLAVCPFFLQRPADTGNAVLETCVMRRDVRFRDYPWRTGSVSTAMEIDHTAAETELPTSSAESRFFTTILGDSTFARQLATGFAGAIDSRYGLDGRSTRAYWINPGYEWTPSQTGGVALFQLSQKIFMFALVTLDEQLTPIPGNSIFDTKPGLHEDTLDDGALTPNRPRLPGLARRALLATAPQDGVSISSAEVSSHVSRESTMAAANQVPLHLVASFRVELQLDPSDACKTTDSLQTHLRRVFTEHLAKTASPIRSVQIVSVVVDRSSVQCGGARRTPSLQLAQAAAIVTIAFSPEYDPILDIQAFAALPAINSVTALIVPSTIQVVQAGAHANLATATPPSDEASSSLSIALIASICGSTVLIGACIAWRIFWLKRKAQPELREKEAFSGSVDRDFLLCELSLSQADLSMSVTVDRDGRRQRSRLSTDVVM